MNRIYPGMIVRVTSAQLDALTANDELIAGRYLLLSNGHEAFLAEVVLFESPAPMIDDTPAEPPEVRYPETVTVFSRAEVEIDDDEVKLVAKPDE